MWLGSWAGLYDLDFFMAMIASIFFSGKFFKKLIAVLEDLGFGTLVLAAVRAAFA